MPNVPSFILKFIYGELSDTILGVKVSNENGILNFTFKYEKIMKFKAIYS